ncbi:hypothetical protein J2Y88_005680 [Pseudomonas chlororaphis]|uniref:hypothetical protein n=1 Tax=Pseudomonas chlororaphis TaxID=587753 RepID=UPI00209FE3E8|nr:hypothetical protein [Pseudomonas chlororaphis]MCP1483369.1 hypothetical protein [Pseudomonas chlororaphis]MCP1596274.1 hypothetical protein [Pseudomonas chlororaphis]
MDDPKNARRSDSLDLAYNAALTKLDVATCEAMAVSQAIDVENSELHLGFSVQIFKKLCSHSVALICAVPRSRWVKSEFENWDFACAAGQSRAIIEGFLLFLYLSQTPSCNAEWTAKLLVLYVNDCTRRAKMMANVKAVDAAEDWMRQAEELKDRLKLNPWFLNLDGKTQKRCLAGDHLMISSRDEILELAGWEKAEFYAIWDLLSQYAHVLPMSFTRMEPDGRGSGAANEADADYLTATIAWCADTLHAATNRMTAGFPSTETVRQGLDSKFEPGPKENRP